MGSNRIAIKTSSFLNYERLVVLLFHELGHHVVWAMRVAKEPEKSKLFELYGLTQDRLQKWNDNEIGYAISLIEEDPDTLSYGVWMEYRLLFS